jgi:hypothetical protein
MSAMPRPLLTGLAATAIAACAMALSGLALPGNAAAGTGGAQQLGGASLISVAITSINPVYAQPGKTVTVTGTVTNTSSNPVSGVLVQLRSSSTPFDNRSELQQYADGTITGDDSLVGGAISELSGTLNPHVTQAWSIPLNPDEVPISGSFGVYPLAAEAYNPDFTAVAVSRTFLPFWPGNSAQDLATQQIAWVWPLIDQPRQAQCPGLLNNGLASSVASGGRLAGLLAVGSQYASSAHLTWAIDPALLANLTTMTSSYQVHSGAGCGGTKHPASQAAAAWLTQLKSATTGQPVFVTPYDDADIAALTSGNMSADLNRAFTAGRTAASRILGRSFAPTGGASASMNGMAWPADGIANYAVLENLAASDGINTVVLDSSTMPPTTAQYFTPSAQTTTPDGEGPDLNVLLSDDTITGVLESANSPSDSKATAFSAAQRYLAETAMITAEAPDLSRSIVVAPPRRWDPPAGLASELMSETVSAPWLRPVSLGQLATAKSPTGEVSRQAPTATSSAQLPSSLLTQASQLDQQAALLESVQATPDTGYNDALNSAVLAVESTAWRGGGSALAAGQALAQQTGTYLSRQQGKLTIIGPPRVTLGGPTGAVPVSVSNGLGFAVRVGLEAADPNGRVTAKQTHHTIVVPPGQQEVVKLQVTASGDGSATLQLNLVNAAGVPLSARRTIIVQATHYGDLALVIIASALGIFLLASAARAVRRGLRGPRAGGPEPPESPANDDPERYGDGPGQQEADAGQRGLREGPDGADSVMSDGGGTGQMTGQTRDDDRAEATDDYAWAPGQAERR